MDADRLAQLESWGQQLSQRGDDSDLRAAGRAILLLVEEIERLRDGGDDGAPPADDSEPRPRRRGRGLAILAAVGALVAGVFLLGGWLATPTLRAGGPAGGAIGASQLSRLAFWIEGDRVGAARWRLDGVDARALVGTVGRRAVLRPGPLADGEHRLTVSVAGGFPGSQARRSWRFVVDTAPPGIRLSPRNAQLVKGGPLRLTVHVEPGATLRVGGRSVTLTDDAHALRLTRVPLHPLVLVATDTAGNSTRRLVRVGLVPRRPPAAIRAVHVTQYAWRSADLRASVLALAARGRIDAVELDLKDEAGHIGYDSKLPLAREIGAVEGEYRLGPAVRRLHALGLRVIGRLVAFRDPILAGAAWQAGRRDEVVQTPAGGPYAGYGGFTNLASPAVRAYNVAVAREAAAAGVDEILYDYIRRPDGPADTMVFPGLRGTPEAAVVRLLAETRRALKAFPQVFLGASVFGVAATRPDEVAQDIPAMAREVDYIAPMVYPSHWGPGEYGVASPNSQPYDIVLRSLRDFAARTRGTGARIVPWLQDFSLGVTYGPREVAAQIRAAHDAGIDEWILWDPLVTYTAEALTRS